MPKAAPTVAAATAIPLICRHLADTGRIGFRSEELAPYIDGISKYDRTGLNKDIPVLLSQLDQPN